MRPRGLLVVAGLAALAAAAPARAETFDVTTTADGAGSCDNASCTTIRAALAAAAANGTGADTITVSAGTYMLTGGQLNVDSPVAIMGDSAANTTVRAVDQGFRIFSIAAGQAALIQHLTIADGTAASPNDGVGGNVLVNAGANLRLDHVRLTGGTALRGGGLGIRGGRARITKSLIDDNEAVSARGAGSTGDGGGILSLGDESGAPGSTLQVTDSTIALNTADLGAGIMARDNANHTNTVTRSTIAYNAASKMAGAGVFVGGAESFVVTASIMAGNTGAALPSNCNIELSTGGGNVDSGATCGLSTPADKQRTDAQLSTVLSPGRETSVLTIPATSPAVDFVPIDAAACADADQRDIARPQGNGCDAGAYEVDQAPETNIVSGPSGTIGTSSASFAFASSEPGVRFECRLDGPEGEEDFVECSSPQAYTGLADGAYTFYVRAVDSSDHPDPTPDSRAFTVDATAPDVTITAGPSGATNNVSPSFAFKSSDTGATFECRLDGPAAATGAYGACTSPTTYAKLAEGTYTFLVRAEDPGGTGPSATRDFTVDTTPPPAEVVSGPSGPTTDSAPSFGFTTGGETTVECKLDGPGATTGTYGPCTSPASFTGLAPGDYVFSVRAVDPAGNETVTTRAFTVTLPQQATTPTPPPTPEPGKSVVIEPVSGTTTVQTPGSTMFEPVDSTRGIPLGSIVDARKSKIRLFAIPKPGHPAESALFFGGIFKVTQTGTITQLQLVEQLAPCKRSKASAATKKPKTRRLWGDGSGSFRTRGQFSSATVRGTKWLVQDSCGKTLTKVAKGVVFVQDFVKHKTLLVRAPKSYTARQR